MSSFDTVIPEGLGEDGMTAAEQRQFDNRMAARALCLLVQMVPVDIPIDEWSITDGCVQARHSVDGLSPNQVRASMRRLALRLGEGFIQEEFPVGNGMNKAAVVGRLAGVAVRVWVLALACECGCHEEATS
jgi:hypothetical protein